MRHPVQGDIPAILALAKDIQLFDSDDEIQSLIKEPLEGYLADEFRSTSTSQWWISDMVEASTATPESNTGSSPATDAAGSTCESGIACASFTQPEEGEAGTFNMCFIGVNPGMQRKGHGAAMVRKVEEWAKEAGAVRLLVETSNADELATARSFYEKLGFTERKRMKDMYGDGVDAIQYCKEL